MAQIWPLRGRKCPLNTSTPGTKADRRTRPQTTQLALIPRPSLDHSQQTPFRCFFLELLQLVLGGHDALLMVTRAQAPGLARGGPKDICAKERRLNGVEGGEIDVTTSAVWTWTQAAPHRPARQPNMPGTGDAAAVAGVIVDDGEDEDGEEEDEEGT